MAETMRPRAKAAGRDAASKDDMNAFFLEEVRFSSHARIACARPWLGGVWLTRADRVWQQFPDQRRTGYVGITSLRTCWLPACTAGPPEPPHRAQLLTCWGRLPGAPAQV